VVREQGLQRDWWSLNQRKTLERMEEGSGRENRIGESLDTM
jgi:hypothetical protein